MRDPAWVCYARIAGGERTDPSSGSCRGARGDEHDRSCRRVSGELSVRLGVGGRGILPRDGQIVARWRT